MQLDDSKHKVYIYDLDAELSDSSESDDGKLVFLPDIKKHLQESRIPPMIMANSEGELAGNSQLVLYNVPSSLTVPQEQDSVRKAIIETRARARAKQQKRQDDIRSSPTNTRANGSLSTRCWDQSMVGGIRQDIMIDQNGIKAQASVQATEAQVDDPDAMDLG
jgi:hypothetical protein